MPWRTSSKDIARWLTTLSQFALHQLSLGGRVAHTERANHTVLSTFLLTMARLQREHPCVSLILQTAAYLAPEGIPVSLLHTELAKRQSTYSAQQLQQGIAVLTRHALLQPGKDGRLDMHRLVQQVIRNQLSPTEQHQRLTAVLQLVGQAYPQEGEGHAADAARKMFIPHLKALIEQQDSSGRQEDTHLAFVLLCWAMSMGTWAMWQKNAISCYARSTLKRPTTARITGSSHPPWQT